MRMKMVIIEKIKIFFIVLMFNHLKEYFEDEIGMMNQRKKELDESNKKRVRFMNFFSYLFLILLVCKFFYIL